MPRKRNKKPIGRPSKKVLPPRIDATPEEVAHVVLNAGRPKGPVVNKLYYCKECRRQVAWPETLYRDGRCEQCRPKTPAR